MEWASSHWDSSNLNPGIGCAILSYSIPPDGCGIWGECFSKEAWTYRIGDYSCYRDYVLNIFITLTAMDVEPLKAFGSTALISTQLASGALLWTG